MRNFLLCLFLAVNLLSAGTLNVSFDYGTLANPQFSEDPPDPLGPPPMFSLLFQLTSFTDGSTTLIGNEIPFLLQDSGFFQEFTANLGTSPAASFTVNASFELDPNLFQIPDRLSVFLLDQNQEIYFTNDDFGDPVGPLFTVDFLAGDEVEINVYQLNGIQADVNYSSGGAGNPGSEIPEPSTMVLIGMGLACVARGMRARRSA